MKRVMMNLGTETKYDFFEKELREKGYDVVRTSVYDPKDIIREGLGSEAAIMGAADNWTEQVFNELRDSLHLVVRFGVGLDNVDVGAATKNGILVANSAGANKESVAELAFTLMLSCGRRIVWLDHKLRSGAWQGLPRTRQLSGKTVGLVGFGAIAKCVAKMAGGFNCKILAYDMVQDEETAKELGVTFCTMDELLAQSDFVSLHVPLNQQTRHMVSLDFLKKMKSSAFLINTSRGGVVNEEDLYQALTTGVIKGAGLDVFDREPPEPDNKLFSLDNVTVTPHAASATEEAAGNIAKMCMENIESYFKTGYPKYCVNRR